MKVILTSGVLILGLIWLVPEVFAPSYDGLVVPGNNMSLSPNDALIIIFSNGDWSGKYGPEGSKISVKDHGSWYYIFSCNQTDSYNIEFSKESQGDGDLILNIIQNGTLINHGKTDSGHVTLSGKCFTSQDLGDNNDFIAISTDKNTYQYYDTIQITTNSKFTSDFTQLKFEIRDRYKEKVWDDVFTSKVNSKFTKDVKIQNSWGKSGNYTIKVYFDDYNKVSKKINIIQEKVNYKFQVNSTETKGEIKNNSVLVLPKRNMWTTISGNVTSASHGEKMDVLILRPEMDDHNKVLYKIESIHPLLTDKGIYNSTHELGKKFVEGCYEIMAIHRKNVVGHIQFFVTDKTDNVIKECNNDTLSHYYEYKNHHVTNPLDEFENHLRNKGWSEEQIKIFVDSYKVSGDKYIPPPSGDKYLSDIVMAIIVGASLAIGAGAMAKYRTSKQKS